MLSPSEESKAVIDDAASQLGVEPSELSDALKQALKNRIDEAVDAGRLTEEQANELKERIDSERVPAALRRPGLGAAGFGLDGFGIWPLHGGFALLEAAASYLGMTEAELREALEDKTLAEIAKEQGKTPSTASCSSSSRRRRSGSTRRSRTADHGRAGNGAQGTSSTSAWRRSSTASFAWRMDGDRHRFWPGLGLAAGTTTVPFGGPPA